VPGLTALIAIEIRLERFTKDRQGRMNNTMDEQQVEVLCKSCGTAFTAFLQQMADHNQKVVCPCCGATGDSLQMEVKKHQ
jgi:rubrerythrin